MTTARQILMNAGVAEDKVDGVLELLKMNVFIIGHGQAGRAALMASCNDLISVKTEPLPIRIEDMPKFQPAPFEDKPIPHWRRKNKKPYFK